MPPGIVADILPAAMGIVKDVAWLLRSLRSPHPIDPAQMAPVYVQPALVAQAWPVQALLESLRRQYLGN